MDDSEKKRDLEQVKELSLIDMSSEDDSLLLKSPPRDLLDPLSSENQDHTNFSNIEEAADTFEQMNEVPQLFESPEPERKVKNSKYNLRKSLAWDSAFFTNAGVLDPEELSCMIGGVEKGGKTLLPGIQEDIQRSTDSIPSLDSDNLTLESLEGDLFEDIRASIQKSSKLSSVANSNNNLGSSVAETQTTQFSEMDLASQSKETPRPTLKRPVLSKLGSEKTTKKLSVCPETPKRAATSGLASPSVAKPPKVLGRGSPMSSITARRASLSSERMKKDMDNAKGCTGGGTIGLKTSAISGSRSNAPRIPIRSTKSSTLSSSVATKIDPRSSCSSFGSSGSATSDKTSKSSLNSVKRKVNSTASNVPFSRLTTVKPLSKPRNKNQSGTSQLSAYLNFVTKPSSSISPASSISDWSSESSASTSTVNQRSSSARTSIESCNGASIDNDVPRVVSYGNRPNDLGSGHNGTQATGMLGRGIKKAFPGTTAHPASGKPSGLRLPSPKIGFFDGAKSMARTPNGSTQSSPREGLHRVEAGRTSPSGNTNKANMGKFQPIRTVAVKGNTKPDSQQISLGGTKLKSPIPQEPSNSSKKKNTPSRSASSSPSMSRKVHNKMSPKTKEENHSKPEQVEEKESDIAILSDPKFILSAEDDTRLKSFIPQELSNGSMKTSSASRNESNSLETNGDNHMKGEEVGAKEPDITMHNPEFNLIVQDSSGDISLKHEVSAADTRIPLAIRDSFCNRNSSCDDTTGSTELEEKFTAFSLSDSTKTENS